MIQHLFIWMAVISEIGATGAARKNAIVIIGDDMGFEIGAYNNSAIHTPNLDALAKRGVLFKNAYTSVSSCSPSRSAILTGLPQHQNGMYGLHHSVHHFSSFDHVLSLPNMLRPHNIRTGIIGKKHVGPDSVYKFDFSATEEQYSLLQVGRNITRMTELARAFINKDDDQRPFLLYIGFFDPHRCSIQSKYGCFCEKFGNGHPGMGVIPDWKPRVYDPDKVKVPWFLPDTPAARQDLAHQYSVINRMDQGIGLILSELKAAGHLEDTLIIFSSDNGIPFPGAKTNLYHPGMAEPMMVANPLHPQRWGQESEAHASLLDITPTVLDWFGVKRPAILLGKSMLPITQSEPSSGWDTVYASHDLHEITMYYPMRVIQNKNYRLIHNLNSLMPFPLASDLASCPTFQDLFNRHKENTTWPWFKSLHDYYYRDQWELYDLLLDPKEMHNLAHDSGHASVVDTLKSELSKWLHSTSDPWICLPSKVLLENGQCMDVYNEIPEL